MFKDIICSVLFLDHLNILKIILVAFYDNVLPGVLTKKKEKDEVLHSFSQYLM